jgi:hypothetical protein
MFSQAVKLGTSRLAEFGFLVAASDPPVVSAGIDKTTAIAATSVVLIGSASDPDEDELTYLWTRQSGPNSPTIVTPTSLTTVVSGLIAGDYVFRLTVDDGPNTVYDEMTLTVPRRSDKGISEISTITRGVVIESVF